MQSVAFIFIAFGQILHSKAILAALSLLVITNIYATVGGHFWGVLFTTKLGFAESEIAIYVTLRSLVMALFLSDRPQT